MRTAVVPALAALVIVAAGCDDSTPNGATGPTPQPVLSNFANTTLDGIRGQVRDTLGRPVDDARVEVGDGPLAGRMAVTGPDGRFMVAATLQSTDAATLNVSKQGFSPASLRWHGRNDFFITLSALNLPDLEGQYTIIFTAAPACSQLPPAVRSRSYGGTMRRAGTNAFTAFTTELQGADFFAAHDTFWSSVAADAARFQVSSWDAFNWWLEDQPIIERVGPQSFVAFQGTANAPLVQSPTAITAQFDGTVTYCYPLTPPAIQNFPPTCAAPVECRSDRHQVRFLRR